MLRDTIAATLKDIHAKDPDAIAKYQATYKARRRDFKVTPSRIKSNKYYYFVMQIPSTSTKTKHLSYDVVIEIPNYKSSKENVLDRSFKVFSNSPGFTFSYAYTYNQRDRLVPWLADKFSEEVLGTEPSVRNPKNLLNMDITIKLALLHIEATYKRSSLNANISSSRVFTTWMYQEYVHRDIPTAKEKLEENQEVKVKDKKSRDRRKKLDSVINKPREIFTSIAGTGTKPKSTRRKGETYSTSKGTKSATKSATRSATKSATRSAMKRKPTTNPGSMSTRDRKPKK